MLQIKQKILAKVQEANPQAIFASNTSTIPMAEISSACPRPEQVVGMHYFFPSPLMPLLEVIQGPKSSPAAVATAVTVGRAIGKTVILVGDGPGFYTSRTFASYVISGFRMAELGLTPWEVDRLALIAGFPQGPLHVYGTAGGNVIYHASQFLVSRLPDRVNVPPSLVKCTRRALSVQASRVSIWMTAGWCRTKALRNSSSERKGYQLLHRKKLRTCCSWVW